MPTPNVSKEMRNIRNDRMARATTDFVVKQRIDEKKERLALEYKEMRKVTTFFFQNCPVTLDDTEKEHIEHELFQRDRSRSKMGVINFLNNIIGYRWPEWLSMAKKEFGINY